MEEKNDTSKNIIIAIIVIVLALLIGYFIYTSTLKDDEKTIEDDVNDVIDDVKDNSFDEVGAFSGMETYGDEEASGKVELVLNKDKTATFALHYKEDKIYSGTYVKSDNTITLTTSDTNITDTSDKTDTKEKTTTEDTSKVFTFTIEDNDLYYTSEETNNKIKLTKTDKDTLQYIK